MVENLAEKIVSNRSEHISEVARITEQVSEAMRVMGRQEVLIEQLTAANQMLKREDIGWKLMSGGGIEEDHGLSLEDLTQWDKELREAVGTNAHIGRGLNLRASYVWENGIHYENIPTESRGRRGKSANVQAKIDDPINQKNFFGDEARRQREAALYTQSMYWAIGDNTTARLQPVPIWEITGDYRNPSDDSEIWAYRRSWTSQGQTDPTNIWYFTDLFESKRLPFMRVEGDRREPVSQTEVIFDGKVNGQIGWAYGVPDALKALAWARLYRDFLLNGKIMSDALATFAFKAVTATQNAAQNASIKVGGGNQAGSTAIVGTANDLVPISSAGKGYDFDSGRALASTVATALEVSVIALTSDPGAAGSSYGSASTLDLPTRLAIKARRQWHIDFDTRVLNWMGATEARVTFDSMDDPADRYRDLQGLAIAWMTGGLTVKELRAGLGNLVKVVNPDEPAPEGIMLPNNEESLNRADVDADGEAGSTSGSTPTAAAPGQGVSTGGGNGVKSGNTRSAAVNENARKLQFAIAELQKSLDGMSDDERAI